MTGKENRSSVMGDRRVLDRRTAEILQSLYSEIVQTHPLILCFVSGVSIPRYCAPSVRVLSPVDLGKQIGSDGATWLDRRLIHGETADLAPAGFGQQVREAMDQRREHHIERGDATRSREGRIFYRRNLLATLREGEVARVGAEMAESKGLPFRAAA